ncbi:MAG: hypothetical protein AAF960_16725, partial [Bacteroidota bacterium]
LGGTTILHYWYEEQGKKIYHQVQDKGLVMNALVEQVLSSLSTRSRVMESEETALGPISVH